MKGKNLEPQRTCVACRRKTSKGTLLRFLHAGDAIVWDPTQIAEGRGGYLHSTLSCLKGGLSVSCWKRAFRLGSESLNRGKVLTCLAEVAKEVLNEDLQSENQSGNAKIRL